MNCVPLGPSFSTCDDKNQASVFECLLPHGGREYRIRLEVVNGQPLSSAGLHVDWNLGQLLEPYSARLDQILSQNTDVTAFLQDLSSLVSSLDETESKATSHSAQTLSQIAPVLSQIDSIGHEKLADVDPNLKWVKLKLCDKRNRPHILQIHLSHQTESFGACSVDLPMSGTIHTSNNHKINMLHLLEQFQEQIHQCEEFWDMIDEIDTLTCVLEPENPRPSDCHRRLSLGDTASLQIKVDPRHPRLLPHCTFLGADHRIVPLKEKLNKNLCNWDVEMTLLDNLQNVLELGFPSPDDTDGQRASMECGICYAYHLGKQTPGIVCNDRQCGQAFHEDCLHEWLSAMPSCRQSFNTIFGECPFCNKSLALKVIAK